MGADDYKNLTQDIRAASAGKTVLISGKFNILHPGHIRLLKFAKGLGDFLIVALESDDVDDTLLAGDLRLEAIKATNYVDYAFIMHSSASDFISYFRPDIVVKGNEFENKNNPEKLVVESYGGQLIFGSGDIRFSSLNLLKQELLYLEKFSIRKPLDFPRRHDFNFSRLNSLIYRFSSLNVMVIGDTILDEYIICDPLGMSQEDPTIVVTPISSDVFLGGAGIVAAHAKGLGANVYYYSVVSADDNAKIVRKKTDDYHINAFLYCDNSRPTTLKQRFRADGKTLLRVNHLKQHYLDEKLQDTIYKDIESSVANNAIDLIIFSDFSYGCLPQRLIDKVINLGVENNIMMVADSQSSSQTGDISKFKNMTLITPTEREARLGISDFTSGLIYVAEKLIKKTCAKNLILTLSSEGMIINKADPAYNIAITDQLPAMNHQPKDVAGGGDSILVSASLALAVGASIWESAYLGSIAAACQVGRVGNIPLTIQDLTEEIDV